MHQRKLVESDTNVLTVYLAACLFLLETLKNAGLTADGRDRVEYRGSSGLYNNIS